MRRRQVSIRLETVSTDDDTSSAGGDDFGLHSAPSLNVSESLFSPKTDRKRQVSVHVVETPKSTGAQSGATFLSENSSFGHFSPLAERDRTSDPIQQARRRSRMLSTAHLQDDDEEAVEWENITPFALGNNARISVVAVDNDIPYKVMPLQREPMIRQRVPPFTVLPRLIERTLFLGMRELLLCRTFEEDPLITRETTDIEEFDDEDTPVFFFPLWIQTLLFFIVLATSVLVLFVPGVLESDITWSVGEMSLTDCALPLILYVMMLLSKCKARAFKIVLESAERHHVLHHTLTSSLSAYFIDLDKKHVKKTAEYGSSGKMRLRRSTVKTLNAQLSSNDGNEQQLMRASLYAQLIWEHSSLAAASGMRKTTRLVTLGVPMAIAISPVLGRVLDGGSIWAGGSMPEVAHLVFGCILSFFCGHSLLQLINVHMGTTDYFARCADLITSALPVPLQSRDAKSKLPQIPFDATTNIMAWQRLRRVFAAPPRRLYLLGLYASEGLFGISTIFIAVHLALDYSQEGGKMSGAGSALTLCLILTVFPVSLATLQFQLRANRHLDSHARHIGVILLSSLEVESKHRIRDVRHAVASQNPLSQNAASARTNGRSSVDSSTDSVTSVDLANNRMLRRVLRDVSTALPHNAESLAFLGIKVDVPLLFGISSIYSVFLVLASDLLFRTIFDLS